jgi:hypothetical protein
MGPAFSFSVLPGSNEVPLRLHPGYGRETGSQAGYPLGGREDGLPEPALHLEASRGRYNLILKIGDVLEELTFELCPLRAVEDLAHLVCAVGDACRQDLGAIAVQRVPCFSGLPAHLHQRWREGLHREFKVGLLLPGTDVPTH